MVQADTLSDEQHGSALGYANPRSFRNKRFAIDTQSWIDRQGADALQTTVAPAALKDLAVTTSQPVAVPRASLARSRTNQAGNWGASALAEVATIRVNSAGLRPGSKGIGGPLENTKGARLTRPGSEGPPAAYDGGADGSSLAEPKQREVDPSMGYMTTNDMAYGLSQMKGSADIYHDMLRATKAQPSANLTFKSLWGDALKEGDLSLWRETCLKTTNQKFNDEVCPAAKIKENPHAKGARATFMRWMADSRKYFGDLLTPEAAEKAREYMKSLPEEQWEEFLELWRNVHNSVQPDRAPFSSLSHADYRWPCQYADPEAVKLEKRETLYKTYGRPPEVVIKGVRRAPPRAAPPAEEPKTGRRVPKKSAMSSGPLVQPFQSSISLEWPGSDTVPRDSAYAQHFPQHSVGHYQHPVQPVQTVNPWKQPTAAFGPLNTLAFPQLRDRDGRAFVVPAYFVQRSEDRPTKADKAAPETTYETCFKPTLMADADRVAQSRQMTVDMRAELRKSSIPLGAGAAQFHDPGISVHRQQFINRPIDLQWRRERADAMRQHINAPTVSVGKMAPFLETREERERRLGSTR